MSQSPHTQFAMADDPIDWNALVNFDPQSPLPAAGYDMQDAEAGKDLFVDYMVFNSQSARTPLQQHFYPQDALHDVYSPSYFNGSSADRAVGAIGAALHFHPLNHEYGAGEISGPSTRAPHEADAKQSGLGALPPSGSSASTLQNSEVLSSATNTGAGPPSTATHTKPCVCISCVELGWFAHPVNNNRTGTPEWIPGGYSCRFPGCVQIKLHCVIIYHERSHFCEEGQYQCRDEYCNYTTKRWSDLKRHSTSKHCTSPKKQFPCRFPWCNKSGNNGFARKDKLNSHYKTVHGGKTVPGKVNQVIKPKVDGAA